MGAVTHEEAMKNALSFKFFPVVTPEEASRRLGVCRACARHERNWCPSCRGVPGDVSAAFGADRRPRTVDGDRKSGICTVYRAYELALASVDFRDDAVPDAVPDGCWRRTESGVAPAG